MFQKILEFSFDKTDGLAFPFNNDYFVVGVLAVYVAVVNLYSRGYFNSVSKKEPSESKPLLNYAFYFHNAFLSVTSLVLLMSILSIIIPRVTNYGLMAVLCRVGGGSVSNQTESTLQFLYFFNYLLKYYELGDTVFLMLKGKNILFLHWFHHSMTLLLCYTQLHGQTACQWVPITLNLMVHVVMYYYYMITSVPSEKRQPVSWKMLLTVLQVSQFVLDLVIISFCVYTRLASDLHSLVKQHRKVDLYVPKWDVFGRGSLKAKGINYNDEASCDGTYASGLFGWFILCSYLYLFIDFFANVYLNKSNKTVKKASKRDDGNKNVKLVKVE
jgi:hypothetical protein